MLKCLTNILVTQALPDGKSSEGRSRDWFDGENCEDDDDKLKTSEEMRKIQKYSYR